MKHLHAVVRIDKQTLRPALFYRGQEGLECYTLEEQHSGTCREYYNDETRPARDDKEKAICDNMARHYAQRLKLYDDIELKVGVRLPFLS